MTQIYKPIDPSSHLSTLTREQLARLEHQTAMFKMYNGDFKSWLKPKILPNGSMIDDNVKIKLSRKIVNKGNNFLFGKGLTWQLDDTSVTPQETILNDIWGNQESQNVFLSELGINGGVTGNYYIQIISKQNQPIKIKNLDPKWVFPQIDPYADEPNLFDLRWMIKEDAYRLIHAKRNDATWEFQREKWVKDRWVADSNLEIWPFEWAFIIGGKNLPNPNSYYGMSDLEDADLNDAINQVASNLNRIVRIFAHPVIWGSGFGANALDVDVSKIITSTSETAKLAALELARDLNGAQEYLKFLRTMLAEITNVPESDPDRLAIGAQSGFALQVLFNDLILKTGIKQSFYGKTLIETNRRLLDLAGYGDNNVTKLHWPNPLPIDKISETTSDTFDLSAQLVSKKTLSTKRGYDYDLEVERMRGERVNQGNLGEALLRAFDQGSNNDSNQ